MGHVSFWNEDSHRMFDGRFVGLYFSIKIKFF